MRIESLCWKPKVASPDYMADVLVQKHSKPTVRGCNLRVQGGHPEFIILKSKTCLRGCNNGKKNEVESQVPIVEMILMDGSYTCFVARLNSGIVKLLKGNEPFPGASIKVKDHAFIWLWNEQLVEWRTVMFIKDFEWEHEPHTSSYSTGMPMMLRPLRVLTSSRIALILKLWMQS